MQIILNESPRPTVPIRTKKQLGCWNDLVLCLFAGWFLLKCPSLFVCWLVFLKLPCFLFVCWLVFLKWPSFLFVCWLVFWQESRRLALPRWWGAFARNFRDNFDEIVCRGTSYRILTSSVQLSIILSLLIISIIDGKVLWKLFFCEENITGIV